MKSFSISGPDEEVKQWKEEANELGITQSRYGRERIRAGKRLWDVGEFNADTLSQFLDGEDDADGSQRTDSSQTTIEQDIAETVLRELPKKGARDPVELPDLRELVFGTEQEQQEAILDALEVLNEQGKAERTVKGGFVKTDDE